MHPLAFDIIPADIGQVILPESVYIDAILALSRSLHDKVILKTARQLFHNAVPELCT